MTTRPKIQRTRLQPEERRAQLLRCALAAFAEHGVARATHSHVAERAGVSISAVHSYFRTREDLVSGVLGEVETYLIDIATATLGPDQPAYDALMMLATRFGRDAHERPDMIKVWLDWSTGVRADVWPRYLDLLERLYDFARKVFLRGKRAGEVPGNLDVNAAARIYIGGGHTVALMQFANAGSRDVEIVIEQLVRGVMGIGLNVPVSGSRA